MDLSTGLTVMSLSTTEPGEEGFKNLSEGDQVEFIQTKSDKGWQASEVSVVQSAVACWSIAAINTRAWSYLSKLTLAQLVN